MTIAVVDYGIGNLRSAEKALIRAGGDARLCADPSNLEGAVGIVLPGVGSFGRCATALEEGGWSRPLREAIDAGVPFLGICVGFQLLYECSEESPGAAGLGVLAGEVARLPQGVRHPQIQWNQLDVQRDSPLLSVGEHQWMYFVHSFAPPIGPETVATCDYGGAIAASIAWRNVYGAQFHPEKSGGDGLEFLGRFVDLVRST